MKGARREKEVLCMGAVTSRRGYVQGNSRHLEDEWDTEGNSVCCLAALHCSGKAKQL